MSASDHLGQQFERVGFTNTMGLPEAMHRADFSVAERGSGVTRRPDTFDIRKPGVAAEAVRHGGVGMDKNLHGARGEVGVRVPHAADWLQWHVQQQGRMGIRPKLSWN
jgi:hypothetical protein